MTYEECLDYLYSQLPIYQREGKAAYKADLSNTIKLLKRLGNPEKGFKSVHIAGTNGKGSVSHMLASVMQESGLKTGLYTSPHLKDFRERIKVNGKDISEAYVLEFVETFKSLVEDIKPSFFEWTVALAFDYFKREEVDLAVIETGLGGRLDSTNVLEPELSIITNIGLDHTQFLGTTREEIAREKAGIIKEGIPVVLGEYLDETKAVFTVKAKSLNAQLILAQDAQIKSFKSDLTGPYQAKNQQTVLHGIDQLRQLGYMISDEDVEEGLLNVKRNTGLRGRWEWLGTSPDILVDMAHNKEGVEILVEELEKLSKGQLHMVWGMVNDKDVKSILALLPRNAYYYFCRPNIPRGMDATELSQLAAEAGLKGSTYESVNHALEAAKKQAKTKDLIFTGGSTFVVAEVL